MLDSISKDVLKDIKAHIRKEGKSAEDIRSMVFEREDSITASILAQLATPNWKVIKGKQWKIDFHIPSNSRTKEFSEPKTGADGIIQIKIYGKDGKIETKGMLFQAKKSTGTHRGDLDRQIQKMTEVAGQDSCAVFIYDLERGYRGVDINEMRDKRLNDPNIGKNLKDFIADDFLDCRVGKKGMYYNMITQGLVVPNSPPIQNAVNSVLNIKVRKHDNKLKRIKK